MNVMWKAVVASFMAFAHIYLEEPWESTKIVKQDSQ